MSGSSRMQQRLVLGTALDRVKSEPRRAFETRAVRLFDDESMLSHVMPQCNAR